MVKLEWMVVFLVGYYDVDGYIGMKLIGGKKFYFLQIVFMFKNCMVIYIVKQMWQFFGVGMYLWEKKDRNGNFMVYEFKVYFCDVWRFYEVMKNYFWIKRKDLEYVKEVVIRKRKVYLYYYSVFNVKSWEGKIKFSNVFWKKFDMFN